MFQGMPTHTDRDLFRIEFAVDDMGLNVVNHGDNRPPNMLPLGIGDANHGLPLSMFDVGPGMAMPHCSHGQSRTEFLPMLLDDVLHLHANFRPQTDLRPQVNDNRVFH